MGATQTISTSKGRQQVVFAKYRLRIQQSPGGPAEQKIETRHAVVGTDAMCDLVLHDPAASRTHFEIAVDERGYLLRDLGSKNGTAIEGLRVLQAYLKPRCSIVAGSTWIQFLPEEEHARIELANADKFGRLVGGSLEMRALYATLERVARQDVTVLVEGESGTGKELVAREIHDHSDRGREPFVVFDCSAVPANLAESELFGHVKGAFTGATSDREGAFVAAGGGTVFLDEIGEMPKELQPKLLRVLESREVRPVGSQKSVEVNVRVIAATNRDLRDQVAKGEFREDLFHRLDVLRVRVPPLRRRLEDVPMLVQALLQRGAKTRKAPPEIPATTMAMLATYSWPGNVRELRNFIDRFLVFAPADAAAAAELLAGPREDDSRGKRRDRGLVIRFDLPFKEAKGLLTDEMEIQYCRRLLEAHKGNVSAAARASGIHRKYLELLVKKHGLK